MKKNNFKLDYFKVRKTLNELLEKEIPKSKGKKPIFPMDYILFKFPNIKVVLTELLTTTFKNYIENIYVMAPRPTTFKVILKNKQDFLIIYDERSYIVKIAGKKYYLLNLGERERAIKSIADLLNTKKFITSKIEGEDKEEGPDSEKGAKPGRPKGSGGGSSSGEVSLSDLGPDSTPDGEETELPDLPDELTGGEEGEKDKEEPITENTKIKIIKSEEEKTLELLESFSNDLELKNFQKQLSEDKEVEEITAEEAADLIANSEGAMFTVEFTKKDGSHRVLNGRRGVKKHLKGGTLTYDPEQKGLISVYDMHAPEGQGYRMIPKSSIVALRINGKNYRIVKEQVNENFNFSEYIKDMKNDLEKFKNLMRSKGITPYGE